MTEAQTGRYVATYTHDDRAWIVQFREPDIATFGRTLASAKRYARSALAVHLEVSDLAAAGVEVTDVVRLPASITDEITRLTDQRSKVETMRAEVAEGTRRAAADLRKLGLSTRDVGEILGISGARIAQIEREARALDTACSSSEPSQDSGRRDHRRGAAAPATRRRRASDRGACRPAASSTSTMTGRSRPLKRRIESHRIASSVATPGRGSRRGPASDRRRPPGRSRGPRCRSGAGARRPNPPASCHSGRRCPRAPRLRRRAVGGGVGAGPRGSASSVVGLDELGWAAASWSAALDSPSPANRRTTSWIGWALRQFASSGYSCRPEVRDRVVAVDRLGRVVEDVQDVLASASPGAHRAQRASDPRSPGPRRRRSRGTGRRPARWRHRARRGASR